MSTYLVLTVIGNDRPGPITRELRDAYWQLRKEGWCAEAIEYLPAQAAE